MGNPQPTLLLEIAFMRCLILALQCGGSSETKWWSGAFHSFTKGGVLGFGNLLTKRFLLKAYKVGRGSDIPMTLGLLSWELY